MADQQPQARILVIKNAVRERDGFKCIECGMTNDEHKEKYGRQLEVHRVTPGAVYEVGGCVTVCKACHGPLPEREPGQPDLAIGPESQYRIRLAVPDADHDELRVLAARSGLSMSSYCEMVILEAVREGRVLPSPGRPRKNP